ncbi:Mor transcription activator family protein [Escherichia coli]|uniref:Mor transcription activator family protein n=1 Tax=Escherichia coli TaxID=562 RepID=UPI001DD865A3|nr:MULTISPECIES: Mor transcription activator family protein [Enterobacterales]EFN6654903.1 hypothetical protein [Escherichia coli O166:H6]EFN6740589.1 hypothetical protein [Escherichia coli H6]MDE8641945.1 Mor transcription activator family protein [Proteus mirabilis]
MNIYTRRNNASNVGLTTNCLIDELTELIGYFLSQKNVPNDIANDVANDVVDKLRQSYGGCQLYFPKLTFKNNEIRDMEIYSEYNNGAFVNKLAIKYNLSLQAIYSAIRRVKNKLNR